MRYSEKKAAQVAAFFISQEGGQISILKLMKLMYLAERESLHRYGEPLTGDNLVSMEHGPVLSITLNHVNDLAESTEGGWNDWISDRADRLLALKKEGNIYDLLVELSDADIEILESVYGQFGKMSAYQIRDYTHNHCEEWENPHYSSAPIPHSRVLKNVGYSAEVAIEINQRIKEQRKLDTLFAKAGG